MICMKKLCFELLAGIKCWGKGSRTYLERERERKSRWEDVYSTALQKKVWGEKSEVKGALIRFDGKRVWPGKCHESGNGINDCILNSMVGFDLCVQTNIFSF